MTLRKARITENNQMRADKPPEPERDSDRLQRLYEDNLHVIYRFVYSKVGNREEAEDLTSQVFIKAVRTIDSARGAASIQSWLFQVARTTIADHWRSFYQLRAHSLDDLLEAGWEGPAESGAPPRIEPPNDRVNRILERLPDHYRDVLICRFLQNLSIKETALRMGLSEANVKVLQFRALKKAGRLDLEGL
ncbi:MAG TPA: sigma-70 family RNA polymerase sigma factor [Ktedonobacterales bacterium]|nr:sigma-70 family RNA polymerase sigma factor [Ktedonobacterales bacterium]